MDSEKLSLLQNKKVLVLCTTDSMIYNFLILHIQDMQNMGMQVDCACSKTGDYLSILRNQYAFNVYEINFERSPYRLNNFSALNKIIALVRKNRYDMIFCHEPVGGAMGRIAGRICDCSVIYMAHGFHFYKGAPKKNWIIYYTIENMLSHWTDMLITINKEDYIVSKKMNAKKVMYLPGIGIDTLKFNKNRLSKEQIKAKRQSIGLRKNNKMLLSVGELIPRKNHENVIRAMAILKKCGITNLQYFVCGDGELKTDLVNLIRKLNIESHVSLLGYRRDISELCCCSDLYIFPSFQEGLSVALMEAVATGIPVICSNIRGNIDLIEKEALFEPHNVDSIADKIEEYINKDCSETIKINSSVLKKYTVNSVRKKMKKMIIEMAVAGTTG